jgi:hypothetical protein
MPVRRRFDKRRQEVTDEHEAWLRGDDMGSGFFKYAPEAELSALWQDHSERIVAEHVSIYPGTRPAHWWKYEAIEPRKRLGGIGTPASDVLAYAPAFSYGLPSIWISQWQVNYYSGIAVISMAIRLVTDTPTTLSRVSRLIQMTHQRLNHRRRILSGSVCCWLAKAGD